MGSCFKNIFNRKKETYYFVNPYSPEEGRFQAKKDVHFEMNESSDGIKVTTLLPPPPPPQKHSEVNELMGDAGGETESVQAIAQMAHQSVRESDRESKTYSQKEAENIEEDINDNEIRAETSAITEQMTPQQQDTLDTVVEKYIAVDKAIEKLLGQEPESIKEHSTLTGLSQVDDDIKSEEEDITAAIAQVLEETNTISLQSPNSSLATEAHGKLKSDFTVDQQVLSQDSLNVSVVYDNYSASKSYSSHSSLAHDNIPDYLDDDDAAATAVQEEVITQMVEEMKEINEGAVTLITVTTTERRTNTDDEINNQEPALVRGSRTVEEEDEELITVRRMRSKVIGDKDEQELEHVDSRMDDFGPSSPSVIHIDTPVPVHQ